MFVLMELTDKIIAIYVYRFARMAPLLMISSIFVFPIVMQEERNLLILPHTDAFNFVPKCRVSMLKILQGRVLLVVKRTGTV